MKENRTQFNHPCRHANFQNSVISDAVFSTADKFLRSTVAQNAIFIEING